MKKESAEPQTIEAPDGFPLENLKFCGGAQEIMAVLQGRKPVALSSFDKGYQHIDTVTSLQGKGVPKMHLCEPYTYEDVYEASLRVPLQRFQYDKHQGEKLYLYFLEETLQEAYLLDCLWGTRSLDLVSRYELSLDQSNILVGVLLGYKKKDIRAWFTMALQQIFSIDFDSLAKRETLIKRKDLLDAKAKIWTQFEKEWRTAKDRLDQMRKEVKVPAAWKAKTTHLPPPSSPKTRKVSSQ